MAVKLESVMIYKEELRKAEVEKERLKKEYESKISELNEDVLVLREKMEAQEAMMKSALDYALKLDAKMQELRNHVDSNTEKNRSGYY